jgi:hypothetical protein
MQGHNEFGPVYASSLGLLWPWGEFGYNHYHMLKSHARVGDSFGTITDTIIADSRLHAQAWASVYPAIPCGPDHVNVS